MPIGNYKMCKSIYRLLMAGIMLLMCQLSFADPISDVAKLQAYISKHCKSGCVDAGVLYTALKDAAQEHQVDPEGFLAIIRTESGFKPKARNGSSVGLSQVHLRYHRSKFKTKNYFDVYDNVRVGMGIFAACKKQRKTTEGALVCYNGGGDPKYVSKMNVRLAEVKRLELVL